MNGRGGKGGYGSQKLNWTTMEGMILTDTKLLEENI